MLGVLNVKQDIRDALQKHVDIAGLDSLEGVDFPDVSGLFIDWVSNESGSFTKQATIVEHYAKKGVPTVLFDRFFGITHQEYMWLSKFNVSFLEPAIINRVGFDFFPQWTTPLKHNWDDKAIEVPSITLGFQGTLSDKVASFEKYYVVYAEMFPDVPVVVSTEIGKVKAKMGEWSNSNIRFEASIYYSDVAFTLAIGSKADYMKGILPLNFFDIMKCGCLVLTPIEHRFFGGLCQPFNIGDERDLDYFIKHPALRFVAIEEIFGNLEKQYPEFTLSYAVEKLLTLI